MATAAMTQAPGAASGESATNKLVYWVMSGLFSVLVLAGGALFTLLQTQLSNVTAQEQVRGERIATLEAQYRGVDQRLTEISGKLDKLIAEARADFKAGKARKL